MDIIRSFSQKYFYTVWVHHMTTTEGMKYCWSICITDGWCCWRSCVWKREEIGWLVGVLIESWQILTALLFVVSGLVNMAWTTVSTDVYECWRRAVILIIRHTCVSQVITISDVRTASDVTRRLTDRQPAMLVGLTELSFHSAAVTTTQTKAVQLYSCTLV